MATNETVERVEDQASGSSSQQATTLSLTSLLSQLRAPTQSDLMQKWKVRTNEPPHTDARKKPTCSTDPKGVSAVQRAKEFSGEMITVSAGNLFCSACREELSLKLSIIKGHGTTRLGESLVVVVRFIDGFVVKQRLVHFLTLAKSMKSTKVQTLGTI